ncbi:hypothetical protein FOB58_005672 [Candida parapsilosis]|uniref:Uncharacterized protein n=2 Tax=Candida parapsilosis TaxID=5480 RepID=G8BKH1_CANPC|nr:uncharacterized protein CPAR2_702490 [Candida parapsilosis]KAF6042189.1 hypothetical protein FOB58_005672 [Candida parapsilosis]KAF6042468.1 hypothetical protein FOB59_005650 [Candida parapsilosis]KAF6042913.1 hypothetical protein FOB60_005667 [Candida parapsilosis]KAF6058078.1 hypothetical protein FOB61_005667 [Candida parapsilosis]KAI5905058.1 hypothetical protein K4G60_g4316 [Candida parapsilosis]
MSSEHSFVFSAQADFEKVFKITLNNPNEFASLLTTTGRTTVKFVLNCPIVFSVSRESNEFEPPEKREEGESQADVNVTRIPQCCRTAPRPSWARNWNGLNPYARKPETPENPQASNETNGQSESKPVVNVESNDDTANENENPWLKPTVFSRREGIHQRDSSIGVGKRDREVIGRGSVVQTVSGSESVRATINAMQHVIEKRPRNECQ